MGKYDNKIIKIVETRKNEDHGKIIHREIKENMYIEDNGRYYHKVISNVTYEDNTTSVDYDKMEISKEQYEEITKL